MKHLETAVAQRLELAADGDAWWPSLTKKQQDAYIKLHPNSKYAKKFGKPKSDPTSKAKAPAAKKDLKTAEKELDALYQAKEKAEKEYSRIAQKMAALSVKEWKLRLKGKLKKGSKTPEGKELEKQASEANKVYRKHDAIYKKALDAIKPLRAAEYEAKETKRKDAITKQGQSNPEKYAKQQSALRAKIKVLKAKRDEFSKKEDEADKAYDKIRKYDTGLSRNVEAQKLDSLARKREAYGDKVAELDDMIFELEEQLGHD